MNTDILGDANSQYYEGLHQVLLRILKQHSPEEAEIFDDVGADLLKHYAMSMDSKGPKGISFEFSPLVELGLVAIHLVAGTMALIEIHAKTKRLKEEREVRSQFQEEWKAFLVKEGMSPLLADAIPMEYSLELLNFLIKYKIKELHEGGGQ